MCSRVWLGSCLAVVVAASLPFPAIAKDGGSPSIDRPEYDCPKAEEPIQKVDGGWFIPEPRERRLTCLMAACAAHRDELEKAVKSPNQGLGAAVAVSVAVGVILGAGAVGLAVAVAR